MFEPLGSGTIYMGDPSEALGAGMTAIEVEEFAFDPGVRMSFTSSAKLSGAPKASGIHKLTPMPVAQIQCRDAALATMQQFLLAAVVTAGVIGGGDAFGVIAEADVPTLVFVPETQLADGVAAANAIWIPAAIPDNVNGITFNRPSVGEIGNPYNIQVIGAYRAADQGATEIPAGNRMWFMGDPSDITLTWSLP